MGLTYQAWAVPPYPVQIIRIPFRDNAAGGDGDEAAAQVVGVGLFCGRGTYGLGLRGEAAEGVAGAGDKTP